MRRIKGIKKWSILLSVFIGTIIWAFLPEYRLEVSNPDRLKSPISFPISSGERFSIWFLHSYDRAFFQENYEIDRRYHILLKNMIFKSHLNGAGFAYSNFYLRSDGIGELKGINEERERVEFMMGSKDLANHTLIWKEKRIELSPFFQPGEIVQIRVIKKIRLISILRGIFE